MTPETSVEEQLKRMAIKNASLLETHEAVYRVLSASIELDRVLYGQTSGYTRSQWESQRAAAEQRLHETLKQFAGDK